MLWNQPPLDLANFEVVATFRGLQKILRVPVHHAQPLTPKILTDIYKVLDFSVPADIVFWAVLLVGFYAMLSRATC